MPVQEKLKVNNARQLKLSMDYITVYWSGRLPEMESDKMAQCGSCNERFHKSCQQIPEVVLTVC